MSEPDPRTFQRTFFRALRDRPLALRRDLQADDPVHARWIRDLERRDPARALLLEAVELREQLATGGDESDREALAETLADLEGLDGPPE